MVTDASLAALCRQLPEELSTGATAKTLGVSKDTVLAYLKAGLLRYRVISPPGGTRPVYRILAADVVAFRSSYKFAEQPPPVRPPEPRRRAEGLGERRFKHPRVDAD
jgi:hypothetical protein